MGRIIGIDYGTKHIGLATTDPLQLIATPLATIPPHEILSFLKAYVEKEDVSEMVIGVPLNLRGEPGAIARLVARFERLLKRYFPHIPIYRYNERYTTVIATRSLQKAQFKKSDRANKTRLNQTSAAIILQGFMEDRRMKSMTGTAMSS